MTTKKLICALCVLAVVEVGYELWLNKNKADQPNKVDQSELLPPDIRKFVTTLPFDIQESPVGEVQELIGDFNRYKVPESKLKFELQEDGYTVTGKDGKGNIYGIMRGTHGIKKEFLRNSRSEIGFTYDATDVLEQVEIKQFDKYGMEVIDGFSWQDHRWHDSSGEEVPVNRVSNRITGAAREGGFLPDADILTHAYGKLNTPVVKVRDYSSEP